MQYLTRSSPWLQLLENPQQVSLSRVLEPIQEVWQAMPQELEAKQVKTWQLNLVKALQKMELPAWRISQIISAHNVWLYRQAVTVSLAQMQAHGWGKPPVQFCVLQLGSGARYESLLGPDQDNAMIIEDYPDSKHLEIDTWMQHLGIEFTHLLDKAGIPLCNGHVMASWPLWRKRLGEWTTQMQLWGASQVVKKAQLSNILLDFSPVYGDASLAQELQAKFSQIVPQANFLLNTLGQLLDELPLALDSFERLQGGGKGAPHARAVDLKQQGLLPLQSAVRLSSLIQGISATGTRERLIALVAHKVICRMKAEDLIQTLNNLQSLILTAQLASLKAGRNPDNWVDLNSLTSRQKQLLRIDLKLIKSFVRQLRRKFV